jgi:hypothetical protein
LPKEWAENDVNVVLALEFLNQLKEPKPQNESLAVAKRPVEIAVEAKEQTAVDVLINKLENNDDNNL